MLRTHIVRPKKALPGPKPLILFLGKLNEAVNPMAGALTDTLARRAEIQKVFRQGFLFAHTDPKVASAAKSHSSLIEPELAPVYYEGLGMGLACLSLESSRGRELWWEFEDSSPSDLLPLAYVASGMAMGKHEVLPVKKNLSLKDPFLAELVADGYGFYLGLFQPGRHIGQKHNPLSGKNSESAFRKCFDQGLGRSLCFAFWGEAESLYSEIQGFEARRRADLWSGVGLASGFAGSFSEAQLCTLLQGAAELALHFKQGLALAAWLRAKTSSMPDHTERACRITLSLSGFETAGMVAIAEKRARKRKTNATYLAFQQNIREMLR